MIKWIEIEKYKPVKSQQVIIGKVGCDTVSIGYYQRGFWFVAGQNIEALPKPTHYALINSPTKEDSNND